MGNQQGKTSEDDLHWLGGFIDGEGSIIVKRQGGKRLREMDLNYYAPNLRICNTDEPTFQVVIAILNANNLPFHVSRRTPANPRYKPSWDISVNGMLRCKRWLGVVTPYLRTKKEQAEWMLEFIELRLSLGGGKAVGVGYSLREQELLQLLRKREPIIPHRLNAKQE